MPFLAVITKVDPDQALIDTLDSFDTSNCETYSSKSLSAYYEKLYDDYVADIDGSQWSDDSPNDTLPFDEWLEQQIDDNGWDCINEGSNLPDEECTVAIMKDSQVSDIVEIVSDAKYSQYQIYPNVLFPTKLEDQSLNPVYLSSWLGRDACLDLCSSFETIPELLWDNMENPEAYKQTYNELMFAYQNGGVEYFNKVKRHFTPFKMILDLTGKKPRWIELSTSDDDTYHPMVEALEDYDGELIITSVHYK